MSNWQKVIGWGFNLLFIAVPLIWLPNTSELFEFPKIIVTYILTIIIVGAWIARMIVEKKFIFKRTPLDIPILIFLLSTLISTLFSLDIHTSFYGYYSRWNGGLLSLLSYSLLYWAFVANITREAIPKLINCLLITAGITAIYGGLEHFGFSPSCLLTRGQWGVNCWVQDVQNRVFATLGQPNWLAAYLAALIFIPLSGLNSKFEIRNSKHIINLLIFILLFSTLLFTKSRSGLLAFGLSAVVFWILAFRAERRLLKGVSPQMWMLTVIMLTALIPNPTRDLVIKTKSSGLPAEASAKAGPALEVGGTESGTIRKIVWTGALRIWQGSAKNFLIGTGPETFAEAYYQYRPIEHNRTSEWELLYNKAHNEFLNYLATTGILGLLSYLVLLVFMVRNFQFSIFNFQTNSNLKISKNENYLVLENWCLKIALFAGWVSIPVTNFWGFSVIIVQLFLFLFPAIALTLNEKS